MSLLTRAYGLSSVDDTRNLYDEWAATYDVEMAEKDQDYVGPLLTTSYALKVLQPLGVKIEDVTILDAGCGTGLVGLHLAKVGAKKIDGVDLSPGMLEVARNTGAYNKLEAADLTQPLAYENGTFGMVVCVGTFTQGHVGPATFEEFVRVTETGGYVIATVLSSIWENQGYKAKVEELAHTGKVQILSTNLEDYRRGAGIQARMVVLRVLV
ncbi:Methyltransferase domain-containing protein [Akanthomyces lecanii RCEF 1005]|uniref:Methyltransferase domain-containing protein n=1 Tax=Akanthomyces lecanii RCEF 1005 TaxID=1081108 RepID=A0A168JDY9_CORDF|nr:Methyltransferase domain-containing protein [Akanthomyces lecanii RCEF 1005]